MPDDTIKADDAADDTLAADDAADSLVADADDTLAGDDAPDVAADAGDDEPDPLAVFDEKEDAKPAPTPPPADRAPARPNAAPDAIDLELEAAETALEADPTDPDAMKKFVTANKKARKRDAAEKQALAAQVGQASEEAAWTQFENAAGLPAAPAELRQKLNRSALTKQFDKLYNEALRTAGSTAEALGEAKATLRHQIKAAIKGFKKGGKPKVVTTATGARLSPPGGGNANRQVKPRLTPEEAFDQGNWKLPN